jgi:hypothetical protein
MKNVSSHGDYELYRGLVCIASYSTDMIESKNAELFNAGLISEHCCQADTVAELMSLTNGINANAPAPTIC